MAAFMAIADVAKTANDYSRALLRAKWLMLKLLDNFARLWSTKAQNRPKAALQALPTNHEWTVSQYYSTVTDLAKLRG